MQATPTEKKKTIGPVLTIIIAAIAACGTCVAAYAGLVGAGVIDHPRTTAELTIPETTIGSTTTTTVAGPTVLQAGANPTTQTGIAAEIAQGKTRDLSFGNYTWLVLDVQGDRALLLAEDIIEKRPYNNVDAGITWENSTLRIYLNGDFFYQSFNAEEQKSILEVTNVNSKNQWYGTNGGNPTKDRVFLLSIDEVIKYFGDSGDLAACKGWYREDGKDVLKDGKGSYINDQYNGMRVAKFNKSGSWWWLRSPGFIQNIAAYVGNDGNVYLVGYRVGFETGGVRPALWLNL